jgi:hypothetical protein
MTYGEGQEDGGDLSFRVDTSARSDQQDNLGGEAVVAACERSAFEAWAKHMHGNRALSDPDAGSMWSAWQGRAAATPASREHFALTAALAENERLREALEQMLPLARNWNGQRWSQNTSEAITKAEAALKGPQQ